MAIPLPFAPPGYKVCCDCKQTKLLDLFHRRTKSPDGHQARCKACSLADCQWRRLNMARQERAAA